MDGCLRMGCCGVWVHQNLMSSLRVLFSQHLAWLGAGEHSSEAMLVRGRAGGIGWELAERIMEARRL